MKELLPVVDDFERAMQAAEESSDIDSIKEGIILIYNKFMKYLEKNGVTPINSTDADFNTEFHEAVTTFPTDDESKKGKVIDTIIDEFTTAGAGYNVRKQILCAKDYGVPQSRERVIIIGIRKDLAITPTFPEPISGEITVDMAISDLPQIQSGEGSETMPYTIDPQNEYQKMMRNGCTILRNHVAMKHTKRLIERFAAIQPGQSLVDVWETHGAVKRGAPGEKSQIKFSQNNQRVFGNKPAPTIAASFQSNFIHPHLDRNFTAREGARLQSFPDSFIFEGMRTKMSWEKGLSQYQQIGNAVPVLLAYEIAKNLRNQLQNEQL